MNLSASDDSTKCEFPKQDFGSTSPSINSIKWKFKTSAMDQKNKEAHKYVPPLYCDSRPHISSRTISQPDLRKENLSPIVVPKTQIYEHMPRGQTTNSCSILYPMSRMSSFPNPPSGESTPSPSRQRPVCVPPRTIHPSLRSHFAIEKSSVVASSKYPSSSFMTQSKNSIAFTKAPRQHPSTNDPLLISGELKDWRHVHMGKQYYQRQPSLSTIHGPKYIETEIM